MDTYLIVIEKAARNYSAYSPDVPGCVTTGKTVEETIRHMHDALRGHLAAMEEDGENLPKGRGLAYHLRADKDLGDPSLVFAQVAVSEVSPLAHA